MRTCSRGDRCVDPNGPTMDESRFKTPRWSVCQMCYQARIERKRELDARHPLYWLARIKSLTPDPALRKRVATIVWWDFGAENLVGENIENCWAAFAHVFRVLRVERKVSTPAEVEPILEALGYWEPHDRARCPNLNCTMAEDRDIRRRVKIDERKRI